MHLNADKNGGIVELRGIATALNDIEFVCYLQ